jgi:hypothetical protein
MTTIVRLTSGQNTNGEVGLEGISSDGRYVLYGDENPDGIQEAVNELVLQDTQTGVKQTVVSKTDGTDFFTMALSPNGQFVTYDIFDQTNPNQETHDIDVFDRATGNTRVAFSETLSAGVHSHIDVAFAEAISSDGQTAFFVSDLADLTGFPDDASDPDVFDLFELNVQTGAVQRVLVAFDNFTSPRELAGST